jgi:hypothetical protein
MLGGRKGETYTVRWRNLLGVPMFAREFSDLLQGIGQ